METLFITHNLSRTMWFLKDANDAHIASGKLDDLVSWAKDNGYRVQICDGGAIRWA